MTKNKRFWSEDYSASYYTEIVDNDKKLADVPNPKKNLTLEEVVDLLNGLYYENKGLKADNKRLVKFILSKGYDLKDYLEWLQKEVWK